MERRSRPRVSVEWRWEIWGTEVGDWEHDGPGLAAIKGVFRGDPSLDISTTAFKTGGHGQVRLDRRVSGMVAVHASFRHWFGWVDELKRQLVDHLGMRSGQAGEDLRSSFLMVGQGDRREALVRVDHRFEVSSLGDLLIEAGKVDRKSIDLTDATHAWWGQRFDRNSARLWKIASRMVDHPRGTPAHRIASAFRRVGRPLFRRFGMPPAATQCLGQVQAELASPLGQERIAIDLARELLFRFMIGTYEPGIASRGLTSTPDGFLTMAEGR